ncbi:response regulator transcription factor [Sinomonas sp. ASV322]|uniref:response regulator transcription factor n=1 Tax=Sinomonas sp. ASV322 TaxID=3041920 RepID=UPI0027DB47A2|nr:response regulator transcription factor [Sinomonas sp. ASV322]MDQ4501357.1 response regulator transcription factor [Sinomonas sp. ASV322]
MRVVIADDAPLFRTAVAHLLADAGVEVVAQAADVPTLVAAVETHRPDVVVVDVRMPPTFTVEGLEGARMLRNAHPRQAIVMLSQHVESHYVAELLRDGAAGLGYLLKERVADGDELIEALERVAAGGSVIDAAVVEAMLSAATANDPLATLSEREGEVLELIAQGRSNAAIARRLFLTARTVESHIRSIFAKLGLPEEHDDNRRVLAVLTYVRRPRRTH